MMILSYLIAGIGFWGFMGWLGTHFLGLRLLMPVGILLGAGLAIYLVIMRFGELERRTDGATRNGADPS